jgi:hypothetical protein
LVQVHAWPGLKVTLYLSGQMNRAMHDANRAAARGFGMGTMGNHISEGVLMESPNVESERSDFGNGWRCS